MAHKTTVIASDGHAPYHSRPHVRTFHNFLRANWIDNLILDGDWYDCDEISRYTTGKPGTISGKRIKDSARIARQVVGRLAEAARAINPDCKVYYVEGNHEARTHDYLDRYPVLDGLIDIPKLLGLADSWIEWVPFWSEGAIIDLGAFAVIHGWSHSKYHTAVDLMALGKSFFRGHTHDVQAISLPRVGGALTGYSCMCLCELRQGYLKGKPTRWKNGFMVVRHGRDWYQAQPVEMQPSGRFFGPDGEEYTA